MNDFTLHDLQCFDAVIRAGGFQAAAAELHRSHPAVFAAVARLERQLGTILLDRAGYRVRLTAQGRAFHRRAQSLLREFDVLRTFAAQLAMGEESALDVVVGDVCPREPVLALLSRFFADHPGTRLNLHFETVGGPLERLLAGEADLIVHRVDKSDTRLEWVDLCKTRFVPVIAPWLLPEPLPRAVRPAHLRDLTQCVMRDTARHGPSRDYFTIDGAHQCTVADQAMKKEVILQGLGWGHLPEFLIARELSDGRLRALTGRYLPGHVEEVVAARRSDRPHGPVAQRLWRYLRQEAGNWRKSLEADGSGRTGKRPRG
ncbi:LysR family transcriptional regulator [Trinickia caryophylli]|uniref:DNA-binding transcriptional regulator, LysR family n=1 Tax=Trinickia caryophylli TaxID=28094 RepID=A0A1X7G7A0_TRICW|nr:LysR family transcriptional regulator [Trinickia caryophylli]PMS11456.1 LysR family transcriptional regulator [Trinickia caryophylli]TRX17655.1 LysR family transcriptional regulator [Trinickia caryophylli]WQE11586.1 LysR family transcriptional regulator [Trinickia caryophylli]SMF65235.1 DNA-binding transcriptional regulator, LysR family [Trinickia caryophylli]GLU34762.1 LysR family transcriptional regulator [Trinickia caryophylli]